MISAGKLGNMVRNGLRMSHFGTFCGQFSEGEVVLAPGSEALGAVSRNTHIVFRGERRYTPGSKAVPEGGDLVGALASGIASLSGRQVTIKDGGSRDGQVIKYILVEDKPEGTEPVFERVETDTLLGSFRCSRSEPVDLWEPRPLSHQVFQKDNRQPALAPFAIR